MTPAAKPLELPMNALSVAVDAAPTRARRPVPLGAGGFTLIEIMVVIAILAILAVIVMPKLVGRTDDARITAAKVQLKNIEEGLHLYKLDNGVYPSTEQGLESLVHPPTVGIIPRNWKEGGYLPKVPDDPWGNPFVYLAPGQNGSPYDLMSYGADGEEGGEGPATDLRASEMG
jgi:general secretion pathway protein G